MIGWNGEDALCPFMIVQTRRNFVVHFIEIELCQCYGGDE